MSKHLVIVLVALSLGCSFIIDPESQHRWITPTDGGPQGPDSGPDAGPPIPPTPTLRFPWNGYMTGSALTGAQPVERNALKPRFVWEPSDGAERFEIQLSAACDAATRATCTFDSPLEGTSTTNEWRPGANLDVSMVAPVGRRYVWHVRACNVAGCSAWSDVRYVDVGRLPNDFNGDGRGDLVVGAPFESGGQAYYYDGANLTAGTPLRTVVGGGTGTTGFGFAIVAAGDTNGDGFSDALISAPFERTAAGVHGRVYWIPGRPDAFGLDAAQRVIVDTDDAVDRMGSGGEFGAALSGAGDVDGDGFSDFLVGAPFESDAISSSGRVYLHFGGAPLSRHVLVTDPAPQMAGNFGLTVSSSGDLNGDGLVEIVVGTNAAAGGNALAGKVYTFATNGAAPVLQDTYQSDAPTAAGGFGASIASAGDLDADGFADLVVGEPMISALHDYGSTVTTVGTPRLHVFLGARASSTRTVITSPTGAIGFGLQVVTSGDLDGDGRSDLVAGAIDDDSVANDAGAVYVMREPSLTTPMPLTLASQPADTHFGYSVSLLLDQGSDGRADPVIGALETVGGHARAGVVRQFDGSSLTPIGTVIATLAPATDGGYGFATVELSASMVAFER